MEYRHYITAAIAVLVLQFLVWNFANTLGWLFKLNKPARRWVMGASYLAANTLIVLHLTRTVQSFRLIALMLALLLFAFFIRFLTACLGHLSGKNPRFEQGLRVFYPLAFLGLVGWSVYLAYTPQLVRYNVSLDKPLAPMKIGVVSDLHLGKLFGAKQLDKLAAIFAAEQVDLILMPGDIMDDNLIAFEAENMAPHLAKLHAPLGVYATLGNHDFFGAQHAIAAALRQAGVQVLWDQAVEIDGKFTLIGRNDELSKTRPMTEQLLQGVNVELPVLLMDHRPTEIEQHSLLPIDLQVSGHAHKGQIFPANLMTQMMYRLHYGYEKIGFGHYIVTSGYGFWGIPMRLGSQSEVVIIDVKGKP